MEIIEGIYKLVQTEVGSPFCDLYLAKIINHKDGSRELGWKIYKSGILLTSGIKRMVEQQIKVVKNSEKVEKIKEAYETYKNTYFDNIIRFKLRSPDYTKNLNSLQYGNTRENSSN